MEMAALICNVIICFIIPLIILFVLIKKGKGERLGVVLLFLFGAAFYVAFQWFIKQQVLTYLFNNTGLIDFMNKHYILYLLVVALFGAVIIIIPEWVTIRFLFKKEVTFKQAIAMGLGYTTAESVILLGLNSAVTIYQYISDSSIELSTTTGELFMSGYERILLAIIGTGLVVLLAYYIEISMTIKGVVIKVLYQTFIAFVPGFFIAFSTKDFLEVFDRSIALIMIYVVLTAAAVASYAITDSMKWKMFEK